MSLLSRFEGIVAAHPEAPCMLGDGGCDWATWLGRVRAIAPRFAPHRGRVVAIALPDGPELATMLMAAIVSGAIVLPVPHASTPAERERLLDGLELALWLDVEALPAFLEAPAAGPMPEEPAADAVALLVGTSGSTGKPRRVALRYGGLLWNAEAHAESLALPIGVRTLVVPALTHAFSLVALLLGTLVRGGAVGFMGGPFTPRGLSRRVSELDIGYVSLSPTLLRLLIARLPEGLPLPPVMSVGAAPIGAEELAASERWASARGCRLYHTYGLSEAGPRVATLAPEDMATRSASVGKPLPGVTVRVVADGQTAPAHVPGEVHLRSPSLMAGYYPELDGLGPDGELATGDWGFLDADGYLHLRGRLKDVIVSGGITIAAREIEEALASEGRVAEAAVVAWPDADYGEVARAFVVASESVTPQELLAHLRGQLSAYKLPRVITVVSELPHTALGKVDKQRLKEGACEASR